MKRSFAFIASLLLTASLFNALTCNGYEVLADVIETTASEESRETEVSDPTETLPILPDTTDTSAEPAETSETSDTEDTSETSITFIDQAPKPSDETDASTEPDKTEATSSETSDTSETNMTTAESSETSESSETVITSETEGTTKTSADEPSETTPKPSVTGEPTVTPVEETETEATPVPTEDPYEEQVEETTVEETTSIEATTSEETASEETTSEETTTEETTTEESERPDDSDPYQRPTVTAAPTVTATPAVRNTVQSVMTLKSIRLEADIYKDSTYAELLENPNVDITVEGKIPEGTVAKAYEVPNDDVNVVFSYDITLFDKDGNEYQPQNGALTVTFTSKAIREILEDGAKLTVNHEDSLGNLTSVRCETTGKDTLSFEASSFSIYTVTSTLLTKTVTTGDGSTYEIKVTYPNTAGVPMSGTDLLVSEIAPEDPSFESYISRSAEVAGLDAAELALKRAFDIKIVSESDPSVVYEPEGEVDVEIKLVGEKLGDYSKVNVIHFHEDSSTSSIVPTLLRDTASFKTENFSVYTLVAERESLYETEGWNIASNDALVKRHGEEGFYVELVAASTTHQFLTGAAVSGVSGNSDRYGLVATGNNPADTVPVNDIQKFYFVPLDNGKYQIYKLEGDSKSYLKMTSVQGNTARAGLKFVDSVDEASEFELVWNNSNNSFMLKGNVNDKDYYSNRNTNKNGQIGAIAAYESSTDTNVARFILRYFLEEELLMDPLDGKTYGIVRHNGKNAYAMMARDKVQDKTKHVLDMDSTFMRTSPLGDVYIDKDKDITMWTFHSNGDGTYKISTEVDGEVKYLKLSATDVELTLVSESEASDITVISGVGDHEGEIRLVSGQRAIQYNSPVFRTATDSSTNSAFWLTLATPSRLTDDDFVNYAARKVSISDPEVTTKSKVLVYTRVWDPEAHRYDFYAVGHDGSLVPCYEEGDYIEWIGSKINTLEWEFTEYFNEVTNKPNNYYELQNTYSYEYLAPQINGGQVLSDEKIGLSLPGRKASRYYSSIIAWDNPYHAYAGLKADMETGKLVSCPRNDSDALTFYFAIIENVSEDNLTTVDTVDGEQYGIKMRIIDLNNGSDNKGYMSEFLNSNPPSSNDLLKPSQGLLASYFDPETEDYPMTAKREGEQLSLGDMYSGAGAMDVNHLFLASTYNSSHYFEYDSTQNFASLVGSTNGDFTVYDQLGSMDGTSKPSLKHGQFMPFNYITPGVYTTLNKYNEYDALQKELDPNDPRKDERLYLVQKTANPHFAMEIEAGFVQTPSGQDAWNHDIIYEFTGDDDFWLYVDGHLVIDLGGIHSALAGKVNFRTGDVVVNGVTSNLRDIFKSNYIEMGLTEDEAEVELDKIFEPGENVFKDYSSHTMRIFYMERGAGASNLHMRFNLSEVKPGQVALSKTISGIDEGDLDYTLAEFPFQIYYHIDGTPEDEFELLSNDMEGNLISVGYQDSSDEVRFETSYTIPGSEPPLTYQNVFFLSPGEPVYINVPQDTKKYYIKECAIDGRIYKPAETTVNNGNATCTVTQTEDPNRYDVVLEEKPVKDRPNVVFDNVVDPDRLRTLVVDKELRDAEGNIITAEDDKTEFQYRLYLGSENVDWDKLEAASFIKYRVKDPSGNYCIWNPSTQEFDSLGTNNWATLSAANKSLATFETSPNGAIARMRTGYKVEVPNLPVGTKFRFAEEDRDIPKGFRLDGYTALNGSFIPHNNLPNEGTVRDNQNPNLTIKNIKGWGITVDKVWSDIAFTTDYAPIYFAVYDKDDVMVDGTLRELKFPVTSTYYYFDTLRAGNTFSDYHVHEVRVTGGIVDPIPYDGDLFVNVKLKSAENYQELKYNMTSEQGEATGLSDVKNVREDKINNTRSGGIVLRLFDYGFTNKLKGGEFVLKDEGGHTVGNDTYTADSNGTIAILYQIEENAVYTLTQTHAPQGYQGLEGELQFMVDDEKNIHLTYIEADAVKVRTIIPEVDDNFIAYVDIWNKMYTLAAYKTDAATNDPIEGVHFSLYRQVQSVDGPVKDYIPYAGYEDLVTEADGTIPRIDETLRPGYYYLTETAPRAGYMNLAKDVLFHIDDLGHIEVLDTEMGQLTTDTSSNITRCIYTMNVPNVKEDDIFLVITKHVTGEGADNTRDFTFSLDQVEGEAEGDEYAWIKTAVDGTPSRGVLTTADGSNTFTLKAEETISIVVPKKKNVKVSEATGNYTTSWSFRDGTPTEGNTVTVKLEKTSSLSVTNEMEASDFIVAPTGVSLGTTPMMILLLGSLTLLCFAVVGYRKRRRGKPKIRKVTEKMLKGVI